MQRIQSRQMYLLSEREQRPDYDALIGMSTGTGSNILWIKSESKKEKKNTPIGECLGASNVSDCGRFNDGQLKTSQG